MIGLNGEIKIGDFGWSVYSPEERQSTLCGTPSYISPEMILGRPHGKAIDIWALGVLAYEMVTGDEPFAGKDQRSEYTSLSQVLALTASRPPADMHARRPLPAVRVGARAGLHPAPPRAQAGGPHALIAGEGAPLDHQQRRPGLRSPCRQRTIAAVRQRRRLIKA